jgi:hypothetical protein
MTGGMGRPSDAYRPRDPAASALYHVVRDHFETFRAHAAGLRDDEGLPGFVEQEFRNFLRCGWLAGGFARLRCTRCRTERLWRSRARGAASVRAAAVAAWWNARPIWSTTCSPTLPFGSGC